MPFDPKQDAHLALKKVIAERTSPVIAWVGAGLSAPAGIPTWESLLDDLISVVRRKHAALTVSQKTKNLETRLTQERHNHNFWLCFQFLEELLGTTTYQAEIRERLNAASHSKIPQGYEALWKTGIQGLITFNLDQFASRSFSTIFPGKAIDQFAGLQASNMFGALQHTRPFIGNVHGALDNAASWIFTHEKLNKLLKDKGYKHFISTCFLARTVLFVGISADDVAIHTHLETVRMAGATGISHYWITHRTDEATDRWAEEHRIRIIRYQNDSGKHSELIECLKDLGTATPSIDLPVLDPVLSTAISTADPNDLDTPDDLVVRPLEIIRQKLNSKALAILATPNPAAYAAYEKFSIEYDEAIDRAWYVTVTPPKNLLLGYTLDRRVATGSFGEVFEAHNSDGIKVAVKLLRKDVRRDAAMLQTFRRGVRSMKILKSRGVDGMIDFIDASEIPAVVVMEWIDGPNLMEAVQKKALSTWELIMDVALGLAKIIHTAHLLPEGVLHRDIRPPNIMLRDFWTNGQIIDVMVMDFDLSWHIDALENTVLAKPLGFMAPEQLRNKGASTRSALVDSFGYGMTMYYILSGDIPIPDQQRHIDWQTSLKNKVQSRKNTKWKSLPTRIARLIESATKDEQKLRWDFSQILEEIKCLHILNSGKFSDVSADYFCEEIAAHTGFMDGYYWNDNLGTATYERLGLKIVLSANIPDDEINALIEWIQTGNENWKLLPKTMKQAVEKARPILERTGWISPKIESSNRHIRVMASFPTKDNIFQPNQLASGIDLLVNIILPKA